MTALKITTGNVLEAACRIGRITMEEMKSPARYKEFAYWRQRAMFVARAITGQSYPQIGRSVGDRDHTTVLFACRKLVAMVIFDETTSREVNLIAKYARELAESDQAKRLRHVAVIAASQANPAKVDPDAMPHDPLRSERDLAAWSGLGGEPVSA